MTAQLAHQTVSGRAAGNRLAKAPADLPDAAPQWMQMQHGSFPSTPVTRVIRAPFSLRIRGFSVVQDDIGVVVFIQVSDRAAIFPHDAKGQDAPGIADCPKHPRSSASGNPDMVRPYASFVGAAPNFTPARGAEPNGDEKMNDLNTVPDATLAHVTAELRRSMNYLCVVEGLPGAHVLAVMHAEIITQMTAVFGGKFAAECSAAAIRHVGCMPSLAEATAASAASGGRIQ